MTTTPVHLRLPAPLVDALDHRAEVEQRSRANMVAVLITSALADTNEAKEKA